MLEETEAKAFKDNLKIDDLGLFDYNGKTAKYNFLNFYF